MKTFKTGIALLLCLILCGSLLPAAFADSVIIVGAAEPAPSSYDPVVIIAGQENAGFGSLNSFEANQPVVITSDGFVQAAPAAAPVQAEKKSAPAGLAGEVFDKTNEVRRANGLGALSYSAALQSAADTRARESAYNFSHTRPDGSACQSVITQDYYVAGENLIQVTTQLASAEIILDTWMNSDSHRANILLSDFTQIAIGVYEQEGTTYISQIFLG